MSKKNSLVAFALLILLFNCVMENHCATVRCYSCSNCANAIPSEMNYVTTNGTNDQCVTTIISTGKNGEGQTFVSRGASSRCTSYSNVHLSIRCCGTDLCNA